MLSRYKKPETDAFSAMLSLRHKLYVSIARYNTKRRHPRSFPERQIKLVYKYQKSKSLI